MSFRKILLLLTSCFFFHCSYATEPAISISTLKFGTVNWTLDTIKRYQLDTKNGFELDIQSVASTQASKVALLAGSANIIVSDWTWVARQRANRIKLSFQPYSSSAGALIVPHDSPIKSIDGLVGKRIGIAGGALDKNWLLLRALAKRNNLDLTSTNKTFGAPPLLNQQIKLGRVDALITYWHYAARLEAQGYRKLLTAHDMLKQLGINQTLPILGYVFNEHWANQHKTSLLAFLKASQQAANLLCHSDESWQAIIPLTRTTDPRTLLALRKGYCDGRIKSWGLSEKQSIQSMFAILMSSSGDKLLGNTSNLDPKIFWEQ